MEQLPQQYPLSLPQQDIYYEQLLYPGEPIYNIGARIEIQGPLHVSILQEAYRCLIDQHDAYRIVISRNSDIPFFSILSRHNATLELIDLSAEQDPVQAAEAFMEKNFRVPFDLEAGELLHRFILIKVKEDFHYLFSVYHHIITDGWGTSLMFQRFVRNYNERMVSGEITTTYPFSYTAFIEDDRQYQSSPAYEEDRKYWLSVFSSLPDSLIPLKGARQNISRQQELFIPRETFNQLIHLAGNLKVSTFHIILGVVYTYFARYYHSNDITVGLPVLNRGKSVYKKTVGLFMGISPLRMIIDDAASFRELVTKIRDDLKMNYRHQRFPLGKLIQALHIFEEKDRLFNIMLSYEKQDYSEHFSGTVTTVRPMSHGAESVALALYVREFDDSEEVRIDFSYNTSYFSDEDTTRLTGHFLAIIHAVITAPDLQLRNISYMSEKEKKQVLHDFNRTASLYPSGKTVIDLFREQVAVLPGKTAVMDSHSTWSYRTLHHNMELVAAGIAGQGATDQRPVAVLMPRSVELVAALLGVVRSGRPYIPLDPDFPKERLEYIIRHSRCESLLLTRALAGYIDIPEVSTLVLEDLLTTSPAGSAAYCPGPTDSAYIIYTSGSTGNPKGVEIGHRALTNFLWSMKHEPGITQQDLLFAVTTCSFDISILELFLPLISGATVYIAGQQMLQDPAKLIAGIETVNPTLMQATPSFYQMLFNAGWKGGLSLKVLCGGDLLSEAVAERLLSGCGELWNMYGPTETTIWSAVKRINSPADARNIGKPINNTGFFILDQWRNPVPVGATGDLYISGDGLAKGYYQDEALTAAKFIDGTPRLYFTGDIGKWTSSGEIEFAGRSDAQVKIRGYRIETGEIEKKLLETGKVTEAVVVARKTGEASFLVAYVKTTVDFQTEQVIAALQLQLPDYMVPAVIVPVADFPLTPNNKIDRKVLAAREISLEMGERYMAPQNEMEDQLVRLWRKHLHVSGIGVNDHFFRLGGESLSAVRVIYEINALFSCQLSPRDIFECPTARALANRIAAASKTPYQPIPKAPQRNSYPLTHAQHHIWILSQRPAAAVAYNMNAAYELSGHLEVALLEKAVALIIEQQESLRTAFVEINGTPRQVIHPADKCHFHIPVINNATRELISDLLCQEFDLPAGLLLRITLAITEKGTSVLLFSTHHIIMDGWSLEVFIRTLIRVYNHLLETREVPALPAPVQFRDYVEWCAGRDDDHMAAAFWKKDLEGFKPNNFFPGTSENSEQSFSGNQFSFQLDGHEKAQLSAIAVQQDVTLFSLLISLTGIFIGHHTGQNDICIGTVTAGRERGELTDAIGMYANTLPLRMQIDDRTVLSRQVQETHRHLLGAIRYAHYPTALLGPAYASLFDVMVAYQDPDSTLTDIQGFKDLEMHPYSYQHRTSRFAFTFNFYHAGASLVCDVEYNTTACSDAAAGKIAAAIKRYLQQAPAAWNEPIAALTATGETVKDTSAHFRIDFNF